MELPNHLVPWDTVKELLKGAWDEGYDARESDSRTRELVNEGYLDEDDDTYTPNPYQEDE